MSTWPITWPSPGRGNSRSVFSPTVHRSAIDLVTRWGSGTRHLPMAPWNPSPPLRRSSSRRSWAPTCRKRPTPRPGGATCAGWPSRSVRRLHAPGRTLPRAGLLHRGHGPGCAHREQHQLAGAPALSRTRWASRHSHEAYKWNTGEHSPNFRAPTNETMTSQNNSSSELLTEQGGGHGQWQGHGTDRLGGAGLPLGPPRPGGQGLLKRGRGRGGSIQLTDKAARPTSPWPKACLAMTRPTRPMACQPPSRMAFRWRGL